MKFTMRSLLIIVAIVAAYFAGWGTANTQYDSLLYGMSHEKTNAINEAIDLKLRVEELTIELKKCRAVKNSR